MGLLQLKSSTLRIIPPEILVNSELPDRPNVTVSGQKLLVMMQLKLLTLVLPSTFKEHALLMTHRVAFPAGFPGKSASNKGIKKKLR